MPDSDEPIPANIPATLIWNEVRYIRNKVDSLEKKVLYMFGTFTAVTVAITIVDLMNKAH